MLWATACCHTFPVNIGQLLQRASRAQRADKQWSEKWARAQWTAAASVQPAALLKEHN